MSFQILKNEQRLERLSPAMSNALGQNKHIKVLIPYDGSESGDAALDELRRAGLPQALDAIVALTNVWLPLSPYEITRAVSARRMMVLTAGMSSFAPALRDYEEQQALSVVAERRIRSIFPSGTIMTEAMRDTATVTNEILRKAKKWGAELIIVGSRTSPSPDITDYAGPALKVAQEAHCSVRIARPSNRKDDSLIRIIIGVDGSDSAAQVVQSVAQRVWPQGSEAHLIAVRKGGPRDPKMDSQITLALEQSAEELRAVGLRVSTAIREGQPQDLLLQEARELSADCIFIDSQGLKPALGDGFDRRGLGKAAVALVLGAHCSVEVVRPKYLIDQYLKRTA
jgi:nucleotide-binding universal stress UspA family protein